MSREIEVWADWQELGAPILMGKLRSSPSRGKEVFSFSYGQAWLIAGHSRQIDPDLLLFGGPQYLSGTDRPNFGIFLDSSPDRWGRLLMQRREAAQAREAGRAARRLQETDYVLGVHDEQRSGALRFIERAKGAAWQYDEPWMRTPPWASLRELDEGCQLVCLHDRSGDAVRVGSNRNLRRTKIGYSRGISSRLLVL